MTKLFTIVIALLLSSCASQPVIKKDPYSEQLIAQNMVETLTQLLPKNQTTIIIEKSDTNTYYWRLLVDAGYAIRMVKGQVEPTADVLTIEKQANGDTRNYVVSFNGLVLAREYAADEVIAYPISPMFVTGAPSASIELNDQMFSASYVGGFVSRVEMTDDNTLAAMTNDPLPLSSNQNDIETGQSNQTLQPEVVSQRSLRTIYQRNRTEPYELDDQPTSSSLRPSLSLNPFNRNMYDLRQSNYQSIFEQYEDIHKSVIVFENDSFILGAENKRRVANISDVVNPNTDVVSIVGCSYGKTGEGIENSVLAVSRANRVKEELMMAGVAADRMLEEACYAKEYEDDMGLPKRGVEIKVKRLKL